MLKSANTSTGTGQMNTDIKNKTENVKRIVMYYIIRQSYYFTIFFHRLSLKKKKKFLSSSIFDIIPERKGGI